MGRTRDTGFLRNFITRDGSGNVTISGNVSFSGTVSGYATESYVGTQLAALVASAPTTLNTLNELATALGSDPNFATTVTNSIATKLALSGGTLTGALSGTSATFSGAINLTGTANSFQVASIFRNANRLFFGGDTGGYFFQNSGNTATLLQIADSGAATFSSSVAVGTNLTVGTASGGVSAPTNILMDSTYRTGGAAFNALKLYLYKSSTETYGLGLGDVSDLQYWAGTTSTGVHRWFTSQTERFRITSAGNVGIGTTAPFSQGSGATTMELAGNTYGQFFVSANSASIRGVVMARASTFNDVYIASITNSPLLFGTNDTERMRITAAGQLEFKGTSTNSLASAVFENTNTNLAIYATMGGGTTKDIVLQSGGSGSAPNMTFKANGNLLVGTTSDSGYPFIVAKARDGWQAAFVNVSSYGTQQVFLSHGEGYGAYIDSGSAGNSSARYIFKAVSGGSARFTVRGDGNVGIGTESPSHRLQVSGNIYSTDTVFGRNIKPEAFVSVTAGTPSGAGIPLGYSTINITTTTDNNWRSILSNINDVKGYFWVTLGDAASKDTANYMMAMTSPAYGVSNFGVVSYQDNGWNTGGFEFTTDTIGGTYRLLVRCTSYYSGSGTAYGTIYFLRLE